MAASNVLQLLRSNLGGYSPALLLLLHFLFTMPVAAQTTGTIRGQVQDPTGAYLPGVKITARHLDTGEIRSSESLSDGHFVLLAMPVGNYEIRAELFGFRSLIRKEIYVTVRETVSLNLKLELGATEVELTVTGDLPPVNTESPELGYLVSQGAIEQLPLNGRNYTDLALLQPGVISYPHRDRGSVVAHGLGMSLNGQDPRSNVYLLDGTLLNDFTNGPAGSAAGTTLGMDTIREFRVETNSYDAEYGRNSGGQINVLTKSGTNQLHGSVYEFHRNDNLDARNFFDPESKPEFRRNQFGGSLGGPIQRDKTFFFFGYEALRERLGRTIQTIVPDSNARGGILPDPAHPGQFISVTVNPAVMPYLDEYPLPNGPSIGGGLAINNFGFNQNLDENFLQGRVDHHFGNNYRFFSRFTFDDAAQRLPTDYPKFPRSFLSRNQFVTIQMDQILSSRSLNTYRFGFSRTRIGQEVEANVAATLLPFVPGRDKMGGIDIGGIPGRFGPQTSVNVRLTQNVFSFEDVFNHARGKHLIKAGALTEHYQDNMYNPTFSLGVFTFTDLQSFLINKPQRFLGLTPDGILDRYWRFTLFGFFLQDTWKIRPRLSADLGLRYEFTTMPIDIYGRDSALINLSDPVPQVGPLYRNPNHKNLAPRVGLAWDLFGDGKTSLRAGYGIFFNTSNQQNLIVTAANPPATPRPVIANPTFPIPSFEKASNSIRPVEWNLRNPNLHSWNLSLQRELWRETVLMIGYAGSRGVHLLRSADVNLPEPTKLSDGALFFPKGAKRPNTAFTTIELKKSDGNSWYNSMVVDLRKRWSRGFNFQSSYTFSRNIDTTQASTFFSDATNGTTSAFPEYPGWNTNRGLSDYHSKHNWVMSVSWDLPIGKDKKGVAGKLMDGWQVASISQMRSGNPLTLFVAQNWSRSLWSPSIGPGLGFDRPSIAAGRTHQDAILGSPDQYFDPSAFVLQAAGTFGNLGRGALIGPDLRTLDLAAIKHTRWAGLGESGAIQFRFEVFNILNHTNFAAPSLQAFAGASANERPLSSLGRIRSTVTSSRQIQFGLRISF